MRPRSGTRPTRPLPTLHAHELRFTIILKGDHTIDLPIRMLMVLSSIRRLRIHINGRDTEIPRQGARKRDLRAPILLAIDWDSGAPAFIVGNALTDERRDYLMKRRIWAVVFVQTCFKRGARCTETVSIVITSEGYHTSFCSQILHFIEEFHAFVHELLRVRIFLQIHVFAVAAVVAHVIT